MAQKEIKTQIYIKAKPEKLWRILTEFSKYPEWNPFLKSIVGNMEVGQKIKVVTPTMTFKPTLLVYEANKLLQWKGRLLIDGIFDGVHSFIIQDNLDGTSTLIHKEEFNGILVGPFSKKIENEIKPGFISMNEKLKERAEI